MLIYLGIPMSLFNDPYSTIITDKNGKLLSAKIAKDGQWRFPEVDSIPFQLKEAIRYFEDEYFYYHLGVNPVSIGRAAWQNISSNKVKSGGSTLSMQVIRMLRKNQARSYFEKLKEIILATKLELHYSKDEIFNMYVSHAPYGGNVVGVEAASWRYFNRPLSQLSWAEYATLAVLPNAPSLIRPGRNEGLLLAKRNRLLNKILVHDLLDSLSHSLALMEQIPQKPKALPNEAFHLLDFAIKSGFEGENLSTSIDQWLQVSLSRKLDQYVGLLSQNQVRNACLMVVSLKEGEVLAYVGNSKHKNSGAKYVDIIQSPRSSGSILKPLLYGKTIDVGLIHPKTLLRDVPISISKFSPSNFDKRFEGVVPAGKALSRSLNIPATLLLQDYGIAPFHQDLKDFGFSTIHRKADDYGLALILGGAEVKLWDLANVYSHQAMALNGFNEDEKNTNGLSLWKTKPAYKVPNKKISDGAWWLISDALTNVQRPGLDQNWKRFSSSRKIAWKTGTSHGFRDAWAVGYNADYLVAVWVGNAEGDGRPGLTGVSTAAPLMFQCFQNLKSSHWFSKPEMALKHISLCAESGMAPGPNCPKIEAEMPIHSGLPKVCNLHKSILLNEANKRVFRDCCNSELKDTVWFSLDPIAAYYYKQSHQNYQPIPELSEDCRKGTEQMLDIIYPTKHAEIIVPKDFDGKEEQILFEAAHVNSSSKIFWHLDDEYIGQTEDLHKMTCLLQEGKHTLLIMDEAGNSKRHVFRVFK